MATKTKTKHLHTTIRLTPEVAEELSRGHFGKASRSELINQCTLEGLRMRAHPGIYFRDGTAGRRPAVIGGRQVWVIASVLNEIEPRGEGAIDATAEYFATDRREIEIAVAYYAAYREEIDEWIRTNDEIGERLYAEHLAKQEILS